MKKLVASVGMVALGASGLQTVSAQDMYAPDNSKPWSISASLRGFYDDNRDTLPDDVHISGYSRESLGFEISPFAKLKLDLGQTAIDVSYKYSYKYYDEKSIYDASHDSQSHEFNAAIEHDFSSRFRMSAADTFVLGQEPDQLRTGNTYDTTQYVPGDNIRNEAHILFGADITRVIGIEVGYRNSFVDYEDDTTPRDQVGNEYSSLSGLLDRMVQQFNIDGRWTITPTTVGVLGYAFSDTDYLRNEVLGYQHYAYGLFGYDPVHSDAKNNRSHYVYIGADHVFTPDFTGSFRVGARYNDYYNDPNGNDGVSPYVRASARYTYASSGYVEGGLAYDRTATDVFGTTGADFTRDQDAGTLYATVRQEITSKLVGSVTGQFQNSMYNGGSFDGDSEQFYTLGLYLEYAFSRHFSGHVGYNYDLLHSGIPGREYDRNRVYVGVTATY